MVSRPVGVGAGCHPALIVAGSAAANHGPAVPRTSRQLRGDYGEVMVARLDCPRCKRERTLRRLPPNFRCADVICDFCGYLAQVKTTKQPNLDIPPRALMGSAWGLQKERMDAGIYFPLFIVVVNEDLSAHAIYYLPADLQQPEMFQQRQPLRATARRAGWVGYHLRLDLPDGHRPVRLA
jgi:ribosomal protein L37AE/L43A